MASHLSDVGIEIYEDTFFEQICALIEQNEDKCELRDVGDKRYLVLCIDGCIEFWFPLIKGEINAFGFQIHYCASKTIVELENVTVIASDEGYNFGYINGATEHYPLNIMVPNLAFVPKLEKNKKYKFQVAAFAEDIMVYKSVEEYEKTCEKQNIKGEVGEIIFDTVALGVQSFISSGTFSAGTDDNDFEQSARAIINGIVSFVEKRKNSVTGNEYYYATIDSYGGCYDVLIAIEDAPELEIGNVVHGEYWLTGVCL